MKQDRTTCSPNHLEYRNILAGLAFTVLGQPLAKRSRIVEEIGKKVNRTNNASGQGDFESIMFWSPLQARMMLGHLQFHMGDRQDLMPKAIQRAQKFTDETVTFVVMQFNSNEKTMLQLEKKARFQHFSNINVIGSENKEDISSILDKTNGGIFIYEVILERLRDALQGRRISILYKELTHHEIVNIFIQALFNYLYIYTMNKSNCTIIS